MYLSDVPALLILVGWVGAIGVLAYLGFCGICKGELHIASRTGIVDRHNGWVARVLGGVFLGLAGLLLWLTVRSVLAP